MMMVWCWRSAGEAGSLEGNDGMSMSIIMEDFLLAYGPNSRWITCGVDAGCPIVVFSVADGCRVLRRAGRSNDHEVVRSRASTWQPGQSIHYKH
jgi:hypothetical protein